MRFKILGILAALLIAAFAWIWFAPSGGGAYKDSPDGKYRISTMNLDRRSLGQGQLVYMTIEIVENSTKKTIWSATRYVKNGEDVTDFRSDNHTQWAVDSKSVSVTISSSEALLIPLP